MDTHLDCQSIIDAVEDARMKAMITSVGTSMSPSLGAGRADLLRAEKRRTIADR
ncbi:hypothetical protein [Nonomuraea sp. CA-141351]|uniref:hypothetical protein n=1 Tax=Nonomuraea sp. CA-141351 TaxID=3239996 RepID=UPI003D93D2F5